MELRVNTTLVEVMYALVVAVFSDWTVVATLLLLLATTCWLVSKFWVSDRKKASRERQRESVCYCCVLYLLSTTAMEKQLRVKKGHAPATADH